MTVNTTSITSGPYTGNGVTTSFPYTFKAFTDANVSVYLTHSGAQILQVLGTHYSVTGTTLDGGGDIVFITAPASGDQVYIRSNYEPQQLTDFDSQGGFYPDVHEDALDKQVILIQQLDDVQGRCLRLPLSDLNGVMPELSPDPLKLLRWNSTGDAIENVGIGLIDPDAYPVSTLVPSTPTFASLAGVTASIDDMVQTKGGTVSGTNADFYIATSGSVTTVTNEYINSATAGIYWKRVNRTNFTSGKNTKNTSDYATLGTDLLPAISTYSRTNFDVSRVHSAGTVGILSSAITTIPAQTYCILTLTLTTTANGNINITVGSDDLMDDSPLGYYFSTAAIYTDGIENNRILNSNVYTFMIGISSFAASTITITTDTLWAGTITDVNLKAVSPIKMVASGTASDDTGFNNPIGIKLTGFNRNDMAFGDKFTLGAFQYDGLALTPAHNFAAGSRTLSSNLHGDENTGCGSFTLQYNEGSNNVAVGYSASKRNTKGQEITAVGYKAGVSGTTASRGAFFGFWAGGLNLTGDDLTMVGWYAGRNVTSTGLDTFLGARSGLKQLAGGNNTYVGAYAGYGESNGAGDSSNNNQVSVGGQSWAYGDDNCVVGTFTRAGTLALPITNALAIGTNAQTQVANSAKIGNAQTSTCLGGRLTSRIDFGSVTAGAGTTYTAAQFFTNFIVRSGPAAPFTDTTPTAASIIALIGGAEVLTGYDLYIQNVTAQTLTLAAGTGVTLSSAITIPANKTRLLKLRVISIASQTITIYPICVMDN